MSTSKTTTPPPGPRASAQFDPLTSEMLSEVAEARFGFSGGKRSAMLGFLVREAHRKIDPVAHRRLLRAHAALKRYLRLFPEGNFVAQAEQDVADLEAEVARHELGIADFYRRRGRTEGERLHLSNAATRFPGTAEALESAELLSDRFDGPMADSSELLKPRDDRPPWSRARIGSK